MNVETWYGFTAAILLAQFGVAFFFLFWLRRALPPQVLKKYSISERMAGIVGLGTAWKSKIESSDIALFVIARKGFLRVILFLIASVGIQAALLATIVLVG
jgi:hypothetical protein